jgi:L-threonylcarbamoyladenylate synthase
MFLLRDDIGEISRLLQSGGTLCYPTDTVWAIGCHAYQEAALHKLVALRGGPQSGYIVLVDSIERLHQWVPGIAPRLETLLVHHARPLTMIYPEHVGVPPYLLAKDGSIAIRVTTDEFCQELIKAIDAPLVSIAACAQGQPTPATFGGVSSAILGGVDYVVKHRQDDKTPGELSPIAKLDVYQELEFVRE